MEEEREGGGWEGGGEGEEERGIIAPVPCSFQSVESVFDIMDMEDEDRNSLLKFSDAQMQVYTHVYTCTSHNCKHIFMYS